MADFDIKRLAIPSVCVLILFLAYSPQILFLSLDPGPLSRSEFLKFNGLVLCIWVCYARACRTSPGQVPPDWASSLPERNEEEESQYQDQHRSARPRLCQKCRVLKPPRAHHCKECGRCIPKMDHHCPWTGNCVSHFTFPHFIRFLFYAVASMSYLEYFIYIRGAVLWNNRTMPSYLGPTVGQLIHLSILAGVNSFTLFMLVVMLIRTMWGLGGNVTTIESWEVARHEKLLRRARVFGGYLDGPDGIRIRIEKQEFPYDIGIWANVKQGMDSANVLAWVWPLAPTPTSSGIGFEVNGLDDSSRPWPPPDPDRIPRLRRPPLLDPGRAFVYGQQPTQSVREEIEAFKQRQQDDLKRRQDTSTPIQRRKPFSLRYSNGLNAVRGAAAATTTTADQTQESSGISSQSDSGEEGWRSPEGDRLGDYGVDEDAEFYDQDDIPLSELIRRTRQARPSHVQADELPSK